MQVQRKERVAPQKHDANAREHDEQPDVELKTERVLHAPVVALAEELSPENAGARKRSEERKVKHKQ